MIQVKFVKWYPFEDEGIWDLEWNKIYDYESDEEWLETVNNITYMEYYVGIHRGKDGLITVMVDTTWFQRR
jgi:hypothetical protein